MRLRVLRIRGEFKNYSFICAQVQTKEKGERLKDWLYETEEDVQAVPLVRYKNCAKLGKDIWTGNAVGTCDLDDESHRFLQCLLSWQCILY